MSKQISSFEEVAADEDFQDWYAKAGTDRAANWQRWMVENPAYQPFVDEAVRYLDAIRQREKEVPAGQTEAAYQRLMQSLKSNAAPVVQMKRTRTRWWLSAAAAVLLLAVSGALVLKDRRNETLKLDTAYGQVAQYKLPDGSEVMLNANSKLSMDKWQDGKDREVWIEGEAFFHVKKTSTKNRFIVHARQMDIVVTGTQFNVVNREGESAVLLKEGSVTLKTSDGRMIAMRPGDYVTLKNSQPKKEFAPQEKVLAWTQAKLVFDNTSLLEAQKLVSRHYGVNIQVEKAIEGKTISGILPNDNLDVLLKALEATMDFQIVRKDGEIIIAAPEQ